MPSSSYRPAASYYSTSAEQKGSAPGVPGYALACAIAQGQSHRMALRDCIFRSSGRTIPAQAGRYHRLDREARQGVYP
jgi:hypothetical protein